MNDTELDGLLGSPLAPVRDDGFSHRVTLRVVAAQQRGMFLELLAIAAAIFAVLAFVPLRGLNSTIETLAVSLGSSLPVAVGFAALALSFAYTRTAANVE